MEAREFQSGFTSMQRFYDIDSRKLSLREYWGGSKSPVFLIACLFKWLGVRMPCSFDDPNTESTVPFIVNKLPDEVNEDFLPVSDQLNRLGFVDAVPYIIHDPGTQTTIYWLTYRHKSGKHFARIHQRYWHQAIRSNRGLFPIFFTHFTDGTYLVSSGGKQDILSPPTVEMRHEPYLVAEALWEKHCEREAQLEQSKSVAPVNSMEELILAADEYHAVVRDFQLARGVFEPYYIKPSETSAVQHERWEELKAEGSEYAGILLELDNVQKEKPKWGASLWFLFVSIIIFALVGFTSWRWDYVLWLIPVLLFHEAGHWAAMRVFQYRNMRMFFIPFFGAAVVGRHWNVPGWKKALVSLAGPLPGIGLGMILGLLALLLHLPWLTRGALIFIAINAFNLLPVLPLDGGHICLNVLFCRHRYLVVAFRVLTVGALVMMAMMKFGDLFIWLALVMALSLPSAIRLAAITDELRKRNLPPPAPHEDAIPAPTARAIIAALQERTPRQLPDKAWAYQVLNVFESLNARPPSYLVTAVLLMVQGGSFLLALLFALFLMFSRSNSWSDLIWAAEQQPQNPASCATVNLWRTEYAITNPPVQRDIMVATLPRQAMAAVNFTNLSGRISGNEQLALVGRSIFLTLAATNETARASWYKEFSSLTTNSFVATSNDWVVANISFLAPTPQAATNLTQDLDDYLQFTDELRLIPPWSPEARGQAYRQARHARAQWHRVARARSAVWNDTSVTNFAPRIRLARQQGDDEKVATLTKEREEAVAAAEQTIRDGLRTNGVDPVPTDLLELQAQWTEVSLTNEVERAGVRTKLEQMMGAVKMEGDQPAPGADDYCAGAGMVALRGAWVNIRYISLHNATVGLPTLVDWLCDSGCSNIKYEVSKVGREEE